MSLHGGDKVYGRHEASCVCRSDLGRQMCTLCALFVLLGLLGELWCRGNKLHARFDEESAGLTTRFDGTNEKGGCAPRAELAGGVGIYRRVGYLQCLAVCSLMCLWRERLSPPCVCSGPNLRVRWIVWRSTPLPMVWERSRNGQQMLHCVQAAPLPRLTA